MNSLTLHFHSSQGFQLGNFDLSCSKTDSRPSLINDDFELKALQLIIASDW